MKNKILHGLSRFTVLVCLLSLFLQITPPVFSSGEVVKVTVGKPSIWTLAQAHYLLSQMHKQDRKWKLSDLTDLDPNSINRQKIEVLKTLLGITAEYDQTAGLKNSLSRERYESNFSRRETVRSEIDRRNSDLLQVTHELYYIEVDLNRLKSADPPDQKAIDAKTAEKNAKLAEK